MIWKGSQLAVFYLRSTLILNGLTMNHVVVINIRNETYNSFQVSRPLAFCCKKAVLRKFAKFTGKHQCQSVFFNKVAGKSCKFVKKRLWHRCFPAKFANFLRPPFSKRTSSSCFWILMWYYFSCEETNIQFNEIQWRFDSLCRCVKSIHIRDFTGPYFSVFGLNTEKYSVYLSIFSLNAGKYGQEKLQMRTLFTQCVILLIEIKTTQIRKKTTMYSNFFWFMRKHKEAHSKVLFLNFDKYNKLQWENS